MTSLQPRALYRLALSMSAALHMASCSIAVDGSALRSPNPPRPASYRQYQDANTNEILRHADQLRAIDPCSLFDLGAANRVGPITYVGATSELSECEIRYAVPQIEEKSGYITTFSDAPNMVKSINVGERAIDYTPDDQLSRPQRQRGCTSFVNTGYTHTEGVYEFLMFALDISGDFGADGRSGCEELSQVVEASRPLINKPAPRANSARLPKSKLATLDPCAALDVLGAGRKIELLSTSDPFRCDYRETGDKLDDTRREIDFYMAELDNDPKRPPRQQFDINDKILGAPTHLEVRQLYVEPIFRCEFTAYVGLDHPLTGSDPQSRGARWVEEIHVNGNDTSRQCKNVRHVIEEAVRAYQDT